MKDYTEIDILHDGSALNPSMMLQDKHKKKSRNEESILIINNKYSENVTKTMKINAQEENINDTYRGDTITTPKIVVNNSKNHPITKILTLEIPDDSDEFGVNISAENESRNNSLFSPNRANIQANS
jgi:hypothetical protein